MRGEMCQQAFEELKTRLTTAAVLAFLPAWIHYTLYTNASLKGPGGVLMQEESLIAYAYRKLNPHEGHNPTHNLELATVISPFKCGDTIS